MFKKFLILAILLFSMIGASSAGDIYVDADWRLVTIFKVTDLTDGTTKSKEVAAGDGHTITLDDSHNNHLISFSVTYRGHPHPDSHQILINDYSGGSVYLYARLKYNWHGYYNSYLQWFYGEKTDETDGSIII
ncbi:MAG: hypothetical protein LBT66_04540 [Methanobrevibacter sp.]|jgi:hypothetical protein|nr:hypothetical protein [Candidatus Methanovirga meridionalis]